MLARLAVEGSTLMVELFEGKFIDVTNIAEKIGILGEKIWMPLEDIPTVEIIVEKVFFFRGSIKFVRDVLEKRELDLGSSSLIILAGRSLRPSEVILDIPLDIPRINAIPVEYILGEAEIWEILGRPLSIPWIKKLKALKIEVNREVNRLGYRLG